MPTMKRKSVMLMIVSTLFMFGCKEKVSENETDFENDTATLEDSRFDTFEHFKTFYDGYSFDGIIEYKEVEKTIPYENGQYKDNEYKTITGGKLFANESIQYDLTHDSYYQDDYYDNLVEYYYKTDKKFFYIQGDDDKAKEHSLTIGTSDKHTVQTIDNEQTGTDYISEANAAKKLKDNFESVDIKSHSIDYDNYSVVTRYASRIYNGYYVVDFDFYNDNLGRTYEIMYRFDMDLKLFNYSSDIKRPISPSGWDSTKHEVTGDYDYVSFICDYTYGEVESLEEPSQKDAILRIFGSDALD